MLSFFESNDNDDGDESHYDYMRLKWFWMNELVCMVENP